MITRVHVKNYRSLENVDVELGRLTVLVGRNGAGKSNLVDAVKFVQEALQVGLESAVANRNGLASLRRWTAKGRPCEVEIEIEVKRGSFYGTYSFVLAGSQENDFRVKREACSASRSGSSPSVDGFEIREGIWITKPKAFDVPENKDTRLLTSSRMSKILAPDSLFLPSIRVLMQSPLGEMLASLTGSSFFSIYPNTMREPQRFSSARRMGNNGENFSSALQFLRRQWEQQKREPFADLLSALGRVVNDVSDVRVKQVGGYLVTEMRHDYQRGGPSVEHDEAAPWFDLSQESDGTLRMLGLLIGLYQTNPPRGLVAVEEPEVNIHPGALAVLADVLREVSERHQVLLTTQSPDLISRFPADDLRIVERRKGGTHIGLIADSQRQAIEQQLFTTGDLLRIEGLYSSEGGNAAYA